MKTMMYKYISCMNETMKLIMVNCNDFHSKFKFNHCLNKNQNIQKISKKSETIIKTKFLYSSSFFLIFLCPFGVGAPLSLTHSFHFFLLAFSFFIFSFASPFTFLTYLLQTCLPRSSSSSISPHSHLIYLPKHSLLVQFYYKLIPVQLFIINFPKHQDLFFLFLFAHSVIVKFRHLISVSIKIKSCFFWIVHVAAPSMSYKNKFILIGM